MTLIKWSNPGRTLERRNSLMPSFENLFNDLFAGDLLSREFANYVPAVNIHEHEKGYSIEVSAPGFSKSDFKVQVEDGTLTISAEHRNEQSKEEKSYLRREFGFGSFSRSFNLIDLVDEDKIDAKYENGILRIELPKNEQYKNRNVKEIKIS